MFSFKPINSGLTTLDKRRFVEMGTCKPATCLTHRRIFGERRSGSISRFVILYISLLEVL